MLDARRLKDVPIRPLPVLPWIGVAKYDADCALRRDEDVAQVGGDRWRVPENHRTSDPLELEI